MISTISAVLAVGLFVVWNLHDLIKLAIHYVNGTAPKETDFFFGEMLYLNGDGMYILQRGSRKIGAEASPYSYRDRYEKYIMPIENIKLLIIPPFLNFFISVVGSLACLIASFIYLAMWPITTPITVVVIVAAFLKRRKVKAAAPEIDVTP